MLFILLALLSNQLHRLRIFRALAVEIRRELATIPRNLRHAGQLDLLGGVRLDKISRICINVGPVKLLSPLNIDRTKRAVIQMNVFQVLLVPLQLLGSEGSQFHLSFLLVRDEKIGEFVVPIFEGGHFLRKLLVAESEK